MSSSWSSVAYGRPNLGEEQQSVECFGRAALLHSVGHAAGLRRPTHGRVGASDGHKNIASWTPYSDRGVSSTWCDNKSSFRSSGVAR